MATSWRLPCIAANNSLISEILSKLTKDKKIMISLAVSLSGVAIYSAAQLKSSEVTHQMIEWQHHKEEKKDGRSEGTTDGKLKPKGTLKAKGRGHQTTAMDARFFKRLLFILRIVIPSWNSKESFLFVVQFGVLLSRSLLSLRMAKIGGDGLQAVVEKSWRNFFLILADFFLTGVGSALVNSALKYLTNNITTAMRENLTNYVHDKYLEENSYYKAAILRVGNLDNADQRIVEDLNQFCVTAADLFSRTFKPALDVVLSTVRMSHHMGWKGLSIMYTYFLCSGTIVRALSPPFSKYISEIQKREGDFRSAHSRLIANAEEIAFLEGSEREKGILKHKLQEVTGFARLYYLLQFRQGCVDQYVLKYMASMIGWPIIAVPFLMKTDMPVSEVAARYRESDTLIRSASESIGDLMMVYKKLQRLAGFTSRVVDLLEAVEESKGERQGAASKLNLSHLPSPPSDSLVCSQADDAIRFHKVCVHSPDDRLLVKDMELTITLGQNLLITGANGAGKTSLFRCLAGLWTPSSGVISRPASGMNKDGKMSLFYVPQRPYLVSGTLRDQVIYPHEGGSETDQNVLKCLKMVNLLKLVDVNQEGLNYHPHDWSATLSGGEKQRVGLARLYYHRPKYAVLDEATSAINPDEEGRLYEQIIHSGITIFSIAHRMELKKYHHKHIHYLADGTGAWTCETLDPPKFQSPFTHATT